jgi:hypothetical protein
MDWGMLTRTVGLRRGWSSARFVVPSLALEFEPSFVSAARLDRRARRVRAMGVRQLEPGTLSPFPNRPNLANPEAVREALGEVAARIGHGGGRIGVLLPDTSVRTAVLSFETLPSDRREAEAVVGWRMRELLPYPPEEARVSYQVMWKGTDSVELLVLAVRQSVAREYEAALEGIDGGAVLLLPSTVPLLPLLPEDWRASQLLLHICAGSITTVVVSANRVRYWRNRAASQEAPAQAEEVSREAIRVLATCRDHLQVEIDNVWFCARPPVAREVREALVSAVGREVVPLPATARHAGHLSPGEQELFKSYGMPFAGLVANLG